MTKAQMKWLRICARDGSLIIGGIDETPERPSRPMMAHLVHLGLLRWTACHDMHAHSEYVLTEAGEEAIK
jgi:hypothetical protein